MQNKQLIEKNEGLKITIEETQQTNVILKARVREYEYLEKENKELVEKVAYLEEKNYQTSL